MRGLEEALLADRAAELERLRGEVAAAKLALAEPAGESPPFIVMWGGLSLKAMTHDETTWTGRHWEAHRMNKMHAEKMLPVFLGTEPMVVVVGWRAAVDKFISVNSAIISELER